MRGNVAFGSEGISHSRGEHRGSWFASWCSSKAAVISVAAHHDSAAGVRVLIANCPRLLAGGRELSWCQSALDPRRAAHAAEV